MSLWRYLFGCRHETLMKREIGGRLYVCCFECGFHKPVPSLIGAGEIGRAK